MRIRDLETALDLAIAPHEANLFDMGQKYADLMSYAQVACNLDRTASAA